MHPEKLISLPVLFLYLLDYFVVIGSSSTVQWLNGEIGQKKNDKSTARENVSVRSSYRITPCPITE